ncbi:hypothetical protein ACFY8C_13535 [Streptomyces flavochromogenes]|uniref:Uncharacterized protein n=1 Tax=Streptomyces flavochromogenes TaxID=68199 RepID=A0ABW6XPN0_9ACTN|nr:hypothetical protein [Streptomyces flavochromogenes]
MSSAPHTPRLGEHDSTEASTGLTPESAPSHHVMKRMIDVQLPPARDAPPPSFHAMGYSRWRGRATLSAISLAADELPAFLDRLTLHLKVMRRPRPGPFGGPPAEFFRTLASLTAARTTVFHMRETHEEQAFLRAMARIANRLTDGATTLALMRVRGGAPVGYHLTQHRTVLLPPGSPLLAGLPCSEADTLLPVDLARDHAWASHQYLHRPATTDDPRRPSSPPPGAESPIEL